MIEDRKREIRYKCGVMVPHRKDLNKIREMGPPPGLCYTQTQTLQYWRRFRFRYPPGVPEGSEDREREEEWRARDQEMHRRQQQPGWEIDLQANYPPGSWEEVIQRICCKKRAEAVQNEVMRGLVCNLPVVIPDDDDKGGENND